MSANTSSLCIACGLCCNGVLFKDVELQSREEIEKLKASGLSVSATPVARFKQPCPALGSGCRCAIYAERPARCRQFECALFIAVKEGTVGKPEALRVIKRTRQRADKVIELLRALGDKDESLALSLRFKRARKRIESADLAETDADLFGELTLAVHGLNVMLRGKFYP